MCRFVAYLGEDMLLEDILVKPTNSLVNQSLCARESNIPTNGDGFGLGWYAPSISCYPALFRSIFPAWNDNNLLSLTSKIKSNCFFGHVRAASVGGINNYSCHPFIYEDWMLMHNGEVKDFIYVKRHLRALLDDDIYNWIHGETDSEHLFALFLQLAKGKDLTQLAIVADTLALTLKKINELVVIYGQNEENIEPSHYNICLTNGRQIIATRYCSNKKMLPETLYYLNGSLLTDEKGKDRLACMMIASEKLNDINTDWQEIPANHMMLVDEGYQLQFRALE